MTKQDHLSGIDVLIVSAGFAGIYTLHTLRKRDFSAAILETGLGIGGTWYWNRYPGARCNVDDMFYFYSFDEELDRNWSERCPSQPKILEYANHVVDRSDLRADIHLNTRVLYARHRDDGPSWLLEVEDGQQVSSRFVVMATGCLPAVDLSAFPGEETFEGGL